MSGTNLDISGFGTTIRIVASNSLPAGHTITDYADDTDPFDAPSMEIAQTAMSLNGTLLTWSMTNPLTLTLSLPPNSLDDKIVGMIFENNRAAYGKRPAGDEITLIISYPDNSSVTYSGGVITAGTPSKSIASGKRLKTKTYTFAFQNKTEVGINA